MSEPSTRRMTANGGLILGTLLISGLFLRLPTLGEPLLEGAAGKQTHTAMMARNWIRGLATWARPIVDDIGKPGYFVKELPVLPVLTGVVHQQTGAPLDATGRTLSTIGWLLGAALLHRLARPLGLFGAAAATAWFLCAPLGLIYSRAFQNDALAVTGSLLALLLGLASHDRPNIRALIGLAVTIGGTLLLKPHAALWLGPALAVLLLERLRGAGPLVLAGLAGGALATPWYLHAAAVHRRFPVPGAMVTEGWVDASLLLRPDLYGIVGGHAAVMVFTLPGLLIALFGLRSGIQSTTGRALLAWAAGVLIQCLIFAPRMYDALSRGTEYYQLPLVIPAAWLVGAGLREIQRRMRPRPAALRHAVTALACMALATGAMRATLDALRPPAHYADLLAHCDEIRERLPRSANLMVIADRSAVVQYYCDRRGSTVIPAGSKPAVLRSTVLAGGHGRVDQAFAEADYVYAPFPHILRQAPRLAAHLDATWSRVPLSVDGPRLWKR